MFTSNTTNNLASNNNEDEISQQISQRNNGENSKENRRIKEIAFAIRSSYQANAKELKGSELEDFEKQFALKYAKENNICFKDILS